MDTTKTTRVRLDKTWDETGEIMTATYVAFDLEGKRIGPVAGMRPLTFDIRDLNKETYAHAARHGIEQKIGDAAALGQTATVEEKMAAMLDVAQQIQGPDGKWSAKAVRSPQSVESMLAKLEALGFDVSKVSKRPVDITPKN